MSHRSYFPTLFEFAMFASMATAGCHLVVGAVDAQDNKSFKYVRISATAAKPADNGKQVVTVVLDIDKACFLFANPVGNEDLEDFATKLTIKSAGKAVSAKVTYHEGTTVEEKLTGKYKVYKEKVTIVAVVDRTPGDDLRLEADIRMQGVHMSTAIACLLPSTVRLMVR